MLSKNSRVTTLFPAKITILLVILPIPSKQYKLDNEDMEAFVSYTHQLHRTYMVLYISMIHEEKSDYLHPQEYLDINQNITICIKQIKKYSGF